MANVNRESGHQPGVAPAGITPVDIDLMRAALGEAALGLAENVMPIGAALAIDDRVVSRAHWRGVGSGLLGHPEHQLLVDADGFFGRSDRRSATLYTTLEPCLMCMGTAMSFFLGRLVFAAYSPADGAAAVARSWQPALGHPERAGAYALPEVVGGVLAHESRELIARWLATGVAGGEAEFAQLTVSVDDAPAGP